ARRGALRWIAAAAFVALATLSMGGQIYFHRQYAIYLNLDATLFGTSLGASVLGQLRADSKNFLFSSAPPLLLTAPLIYAGRLVPTGSVPADASCPAHVAEGPNAPETNAAAPARLPLMQMRSNSSTTAIELAVLWSGLQPTASREALHTAPLLFDYAKSARLE